ncbi:hypothetical protein [Rhizorhabdus sp. FW153]|uniref:hypothetical protein n=1 Tax=Rhizorhabdus sp. FW153 TaxID=3400216 RepID=UPI003CF81A96
MATAVTSPPGQAAPVEDEPSVSPALPQPVVLDWSGSFRLSDPPRNLPAGAAIAPIEDAARAARAENEAKRAARALGVEDRSTTSATRTGYRRMASEGQSITVQPPEAKGPVNVGARIGNYRAVPDTGQISARDVRLSVGLDF